MEFRLESFARGGLFFLVRFMVNHFDRGLSKGFSAGCFEMNV